MAYVLKYDDTDGFIAETLDTGGSGDTFNVTLGGSINGVNLNFSTPTDFLEDSIRVYRNGQRQTHGSDYTVSESGGVGTGFDRITFDALCTPVSGDVLTADYTEA